jgi:molecular chaperone DnaK (HSP70)
MSHYSIGIDLGTTHTALSYLDLNATEPRQEQAVLAIPQLTAIGTVDARPLLPSFLYLASEQEFPAGALELPWSAKNKTVVGEFARTHGAKVPTRLVSSAKSWLSHAGVDRTSALLPWQAPLDVEKVSPVDASAHYLAHLRAAWNKEFGGRGGDGFEKQDIVLTVPASFDAAARDLTLKAAVEAGCSKNRRRRSTRGSRRPATVFANTSTSAM